MQDRLLFSREDSGTIGIWFMIFEVLHTSKSQTVLKHNWQWFFPGASGRRDRIGIFYLGGFKAFSHDIHCPWYIPSLLLVMNCTMRSCLSLTGFSKYFIQKTFSHYLYTPPSYQYSFIKPRIGSLYSDRSSFLFEYCNPKWVSWWTFDELSEKEFIIET